MKNSFLIYHEYKEILEDLTDEEVGILFRAILDYEIEGTIPNFKGLMKMAFKVIQGNLDRDRNKYDKRCETSAENGKLGGRPRKSNKNLKEPNQKPKKPKKADTDNDTDNETDNDTDNDTDNETDKTSDNLFNFIQSAFGRTLNSIEYDAIASWNDNDLTRYAIKESILNGARSIRYIQTVLSSWESKGFKTVQDVQAYQQKYKKSKNKQEESLPEWFDKDLDNEPLTESEKKELNDILNSISSDRNG